MLISIIIATYNSERTLRQCLESIVSQNYKSLEVIIKDGGSVDSTLNIVNEFRSLIDIMTITGDDDGVYDAWNQALLKCKGNWITFLGSDDFFISDTTLSNIVPYLRKAEKCDSQLVYGRNHIVNLDGGYIDELGVPWDIAKQTIDKKMTIRHPGCFVTPDLVELVGGFDPDYKIIGDYDFVMSSVNKTDFLYYPFSSVAHRIGGLSISPSRSLDVVKENFKLRGKHRLTPRFLIDSLLIKRITLYIMSCVFGDEKIISLLSRFK